MIVTVKLFGTLPTHFKDYDPEKGLKLEIPDGSSVKDLLARLDIPDNTGCFVSMNNQVAKKEQKLTANAVIFILQSLAGG